MRKTKRVHIPDDETLKTLYPDAPAREHVNRYIGDHLECPNCGSTTEYYRGIAICLRCRTEIEF